MQRTITRMRNGGEMCFFLSKSLKRTIITVTINNNCAKNRTHLISLYAKYNFALGLLLENHYNDEYGTL